MDNSCGKVSSKSQVGCDCAAESDIDNRSTVVPSSNNNNNNSSAVVRVWSETFESEEALQKVMAEREQQSKQQVTASTETTEQHGCNCPCHQHDAQHFHVDPHRKPVLHMVGLFHTVCSAKYSHCAFTGKVLRFAKMMHFYGYKVIEYSNGVSESEADEKVMMLSEARLNQMRQRNSKEQFVGMDAIVGSPVWLMFNQKLLPEICKRAQDGDIICHPFGKVHEALVDLLPHCFHVETGIGYPDTWLANRIFESSAWMHYKLGKEQSGGQNYCEVIPNYFDLDEWQVCLEPGNYTSPIEPHVTVKGPYVLYFGRIDAVKGMDTVVEIARRIDRPLVMCGQGDPKPWLEKCSKNLIYVPPISGKQRSDLLKNALCALMPTVFVEPFGGSGVEAMLCGTPLIAVNCGAFRETIIHGVTGFICNTLGDWLDGIKAIELLDRSIIAQKTRDRYSLQACGKLYDIYFQNIAELAGEGWFADHSHNLQGQMARQVEAKRAAKQTTQSETVDSGNLSKSTDGK